MEYIDWFSQKLNMLNSRRHHARTDIAMRDEPSDMDYPIWIIRYGLSDVSEMKKGDGAAVFG